MGGSNVSGINEPFSQLLRMGPRTQSTRRPDVSRPAVLSSSMTRTEWTQAHAASDGAIADPRARKLTFRQLSEWVSSLLIGSGA